MVKMLKPTEVVPMKYAVVAIHVVDADFTGIDFINAARLVSTFHGIA